MSLKSETATEKPVEANAYDYEWIRDTWGWDSPDEFIRSKGSHLRPRIQYALKLADLRKGMHVLDIGCGRGEIVLYCARNDIEAVGVDYSKDVISIAERAKARHTEEQQRRMTFICDDVKNIKDVYFDRIFMLDLVEHLHDWELDQLFRVCLRLLKPAGEIIIHTLPNAWLYDITYKRIIRFFLRKLPEDPRGEKEKAIHINEMNIHHLNTLLRTNDFNGRIWIEDLMTRQARWHHKGEVKGRQEKIYRWMRNPLIGRLYRMVCMTPLRLLIANDIFAVARHKGEAIPFRRPMRRHVTESMFLYLKECRR